ncbi:MAG: YdcF family protein [Acidobacteriota bacterium]|nr:YdcF family protein [Acidobacteriota bacterium]
MLRRLVTALLILGGLWLVAVALLFVWPQASDAPPAHADAVVVLSGGGNWRLDPALRLVERGVAPILAISSAFRDPRWTKAHRLCNGQDGRLRFKVICFQAVPYSTRGEAETVTRLAKRAGWNRIVVVTSMYHVTRARMLFRRCFHGRLWTVGTSSQWYWLPVEWASETVKLAAQATFYELGC